MKLRPPRWVEVNPDDLLRNSWMCIFKLCLLPVSDLFIHMLVNCPSTCTATGGGGKRGGETGVGGGGGEGDGRTNNLPLPIRFGLWEQGKDVLQHVVNSLDLLQSIKQDNLTPSEKNCSGSHSALSRGQSVLVSLLQDTCNLNRN